MYQNGTAGLIYYVTDFKNIDYNRCIGKVKLVDKPVRG